MLTKELLEMAKKAEIPEVLEAVAAVVADHASRSPDDQEGDWFRIVHELKELAGRVREYEDHFSARMG
jgi:hypothetical protein